ncbi:MAG TPA: Hsp20/alpha crystallin family protein [Stenomitos sp.]
MALTRWEPSGMRSLRDQINRMFEDVMTPALRGMQGPAVDVFQRENEIVVEAELPGLDIKDVEINATENLLTLQGTSQREAEVKEENFYRAERRWGSFFRSIELPAPIDPEQATASFKNGVLTVRAPLAAGAKPRKVSISSGAERSGSQNEITPATDQS